MVAAAGMNPETSRGGRDGRWRIGPVDSVRDAQVHALFEEVFGTAKPPAWWDWKYGEGRGLAMGAWRGDRLVAHYAGFPRQVCWNGGQTAALQIGDVMVRVRERGRLTRKGPFQQCASAFLEIYLGAGRPYLLGFGFPHLRALLLAERLGLYERVDRMTEILWPPLPDRPLWRSRVRPVRLREQLGLVEDLWRQMRAGLGEAILGMRDSAYWFHRYARHPEHEYHCFLLQQRLTGRALGILVLRREGERCLWVDWVGDPAFLEEAVRQGRRLASRFGTVLYTWASTLPVRRLATTGGAVRPLDVYVPACAWTKGPEPRTVRDRWWLVPGDTDFF